MKIQDNTKYFFSLKIKKKVLIVDIKIKSFFRDSICSYKQSMHDNSIKLATTPTTNHKRLFKVKVPPGCAIIKKEIIVAVFKYCVFFIF